MERKRVFFSWKMASTSIPVVDFEKYGLHVSDPLSVKSDVLEKTAKEVYGAFSTIGFLHLINHGIDQAKIDEVFSVSKTFFSLPVEEKQKCARGIDENNGWVSLERETLNPDRHIGDLKEAFNFSPSETEKWPADLQFKSSITDFYNQCKHLTERVLDVLSIALKLEDRSFMRKCHSQIGQKGNKTAMRSLYYPELPKDGVKPMQVRCGEHSDYGTVTLLFQDGVGGLEVQNTHNEYVPATTVPGAVLVNIGDLMQRWTSDELKATKHRVLIPEEEVKKKQSRQSIAFFIHPDNDVIIKCLDGSNKYEPISSLDYLNYRFSVTY